MASKDPFAAFGGAPKKAAPMAEEDTPDVEAQGAQEALDAIAANDPLAFKEAFRAMFDACMASSPDEADEAEPVEL